MKLPLEWLAWVLSGLLLAAAPTAFAAAAPPAAPPEVLSDPAELAALDELLGGDAWARRALGVMRLESIPESLALPRLLRAVQDPSWQVRAFAVAVAARRRAPLELATLLADEPHPLVVRTMLRCRVPFEAEKLERGLEVLRRSGSDADRLLGVELALASGDEARRELAEETFVSVVLRMDPAEAGRLSPRLAAISAAPDLRRDHRWRAWLRSNRGRIGLAAAWMVPEADDEAEWAALRRNAIAALDTREFVGLVEYIRDLASRRLDLAIAIDCTASMTGELAEVQGGLDDLMLFAGDITAGVRIGVVAYRDRRDRFETVARDFTASIPQAREWLWSLTAEGGGDRPEAVHPALERLFTTLSWDPQRTGIAILIGDAPPHPGFGGACVSLAARAAAAGVVTHVVSAAPASEPDPEAEAQGDADDAGPNLAARRRSRRTGPPEHFPEIATAGGGRLVELADDDSLVGEIVGLTLGDRFEDAMRGFFSAYLEVCR